MNWRRLGHFVYRVFFPRSLRFQLLSRSLFILIGLLILIGSFQQTLMEKFLYKNKVESIKGQVLSIPGEVWVHVQDKFNSFDFRNPLVSLYGPDTSIVFIDLKGNFSILFDSSRHGPPPQLAQQDYENVWQLPRGEPDYQVVDEDAKRLVVLMPIYLHDRQIGIVQVTTSLRPVMEVLGRQFLTFLGLSILALLVGVVLFLPVLRRTLVPLSHMGNLVEQINAGNLNERLPATQGQVEIDRLAVSFNGMLKRLEHSFAAEKEAKEQMRRFIADASHELRTPMTSIHGFLEVLLRGAASNPDQLHRALVSMHEESERLTKLVQDLLLLAKLDRTPSFDMAETRVDLLVANMESQLCLLAKEREVQLNIAPDVTAVLDRDRFKQVILNLFQNAVQHTDQWTGKIEVSLQQAADGITLSVQDNGPGISQEHVAHLFERFYRVDSARARKNGGSGLGLAITKSIVDIHRGTIACKSLIGKGSTFTVWLPGKNPLLDHT